MPRVFLLLGSNLGDRSAMLSRARQLIEADVAPLLSSSQVYEGAPWGAPEQAYFPKPSP